MKSRSSDDRSPGRAGRVALLVGLLGLFAALKAEFNPYPITNRLDIIASQISWMSQMNDASFYVQVAGHVIDGQGFTTSISAFNQGIPYFPYPCAVQPLWPLVLAAFGKAIGLIRAAAWVPRLFYLLGLLLLYLLTAKLTSALTTNQDRTGMSGLRFVTPAHFVVALFGLNAIFFVASSLPLTESLALCFLFLLPLTIDRASQSVWWAAAAGGLAGLTYLTRSQLILVIGAIPLAIVLTSPSDRRRWFRALVSLLAGALIAAIWVWRLTAWYGPFHLMKLVDFTAFRATDVLPPLTWAAWESSVFAMILERIRAFFAVAFDPLDQFGYVRSFGCAAYLPFLAGLAWLSNGRSWAERITRLRAPVVLGVLAVAIAALLPVHLLKGNQFEPYYFDHRYGLVLILVIAPAAALILSGRQSRVLQWLAVACLMHGLWIGGRSTVTMHDRVHFSPPREAVQELNRWLATRPQMPTIVAVDGYMYGAATPANYHAIRCSDSPDTVRLYFERLGATYLLIESNQTKCAFFPDLASHLVPAEHFGTQDPIQLWSWGTGAPGASNDGP